MSDRHFDQYLDAMQMDCPLPLLKMKQALRHMDNDTVLKVCTTDAGSVRDFTAFVDNSPHQMLEMYENESCYCFFIMN